MSNEKPQLPDTSHDYINWLCNQLCHMRYMRDTLMTDFLAQRRNHRDQVDALRTEIQELQADLDAQREANALLQHELDALKAMMDAEQKAVEASLTQAETAEQPWQDPRTLTQEQRDAMPCVAPKVGNVVIRRDGTTRRIINMIGENHPFDDAGVFYQPDGSFAELKESDIIAIVPEGVDIQPDNA